jgi:3-phosphoshikimate 1-carboxyvinyltransferase
MSEIHASDKSVSQRIQPARNISGSLRMPGDKSISHRYAMLAAFASGESTIENYATGEDCASTLRCVETLGARVLRGSGGELRIGGRAGEFTPPDAHLDCGNSGSTMRMLAGLLAGQTGSFTLAGDASLNRRPMQRVATPLIQMGAEVALTDGHAPIQLRGGRLLAIDYTPPVPSAQVKSAVLFAGLQADGETTVRESVRTRDHSELALRAFGAQLERTIDTVTIRGAQTLRGIDAVVPGDISSAAFFLCAALLFPASNLLLDDLGLNPTRAALLDVLTALGLRIGVLKMEERHGELVGTLHAQGALDGPIGAEISGSLAAQLIDELPVLAAIAPYTQNGVRIRDARELRVKESDRIALVAKNLRAMGAEVVEHEDGLDVPGQQALHGAAIETGGDHRIAMAFSVAALRAEGDTEIRGAECAAVSFPEFYSHLAAVSEY